MDFRSFLKQQTDANQPIFLDGGMGTMIQASGLKDFACPEELCFTHPEVITSIHAQYLAAGSQIITTNTFGANPLKLAVTKYSVEETYQRAVACVRAAIAKNGGDQPRFVAADIGPIGQLLEPLGKLSFDEAYEAFKASAISAEKAGADLAFIETMTDLYEMKAAILAVKENTSLPLFASMAFEADRRTLTGSDPLAIATLLESLRVDALGFNCGGSLEDAAVLSEQFAAATNLPLLTEPNAGLPVVEDGKTVFKVEPEAFAACQVGNAQRGFRILGGCCGTTPKHIAAMVQAMPKELPVRPHHPPVTRVTSSRKTVEIGNVPGGVGPKIIGERINPTGKKKCKAALLAGDISFVLGEAERQINAGAHILDVNVGLPGIDESEMMLSVVKALQRTFDVPLQIDSSEPAVLDRAMRYVNGKPLVNSVNGKQVVMDAVFPLIQKYGGTVVALCLDEKGIPPTAEGRIAIARKIIAEAAKYGIGPENILVDTLTLTVSSQQKEAMATLSGIQQLKAEFGARGLKTVLGVSNISFGLPRRELVNSHFFGMALFAGLDAGIINPLSEEMMDAYRVYRAIGAFDQNCLSYIDRYTGTVARHAAESAQAPTAAGPVQEKKEHTPFQEIIIKGFVDSVAQATEKLLETDAPMKIVNEQIVPALDEVGKEFEAGRKFLPQLLLSAQTVARAFEVIKAFLAKSGVVQESKGTILMATVQGDIHDIGKNIVVAMLENYGYTVIDLGKDVPGERIVERAVKDDIKLIGLSALMTTTVAQMERTIQLLRKAEKETGKRFQVVVGGAVLTEDYAKKIGAEYYAKDAMGSVAVARKVFGK